MDQLSRIASLFAEGGECFLGDDDSGNPIVIWINKLNPFEVEEARRDGITRRGLRMALLSREDSPERQQIVSEMGMWSDDELREHWANQQAEENFLKALDDLESEEDWAEKSDWLQRAPALLEGRSDAEAEELMKEFSELALERQKRILANQERRHQETMSEARERSREELERSFLENWRQRLTLDDYLEEKRITELHIAMRKCEATRLRTKAGDAEWDHGSCDHSLRLTGTDKDARSRVRALPAVVIERAAETLDAITANQREAGNSAAPQSSSAWSERSNVSEEVSTPSSLEEMPSDAPTT